MNARTRAAAAALLLLGTVAAGLAGCGGQQQETGSTAVDTGEKTTPAGQPVPPMSQQRQDKAGN